MAAIVAAIPANYTPRAAIAAGAVRGVLAARVPDDGPASMGGPAPKGVRAQDTVTAGPD